MLCMGAAKAQEGPMNQGDYALEIRMSPNISGGTIFSMNNIRGRFALGNGDNLRVELSFNMNSNNGKSSVSIPCMGDYATTAAYQDAVDDYNHAILDYDKVRYGYYGLNLGYEHFMGGTDKIRPFVGGQIGFRKNYAHEHDFVNRNTMISGIKTWYTDDVEISNECTVSGTTRNASFAFNFGAFAGVDYYIYKGVYIGAELNVSGSWTKNLRVKSVYTTTNPTVTVKEHVHDATNKGAAFAFGYGITPMLRLGWSF